MEALGGELDAADLRGSDDIAGDADHEQVAEPLVEDDLRRDPRIGAAEHDRERLLAVRELGAPRLAQECLDAAHVGHEAEVSFAQTVECFARRDHGSHRWDPGANHRRRPAAMTAGVESGRGYSRYNRSSS